MGVFGLVCLGLETEKKTVRARWQFGVINGNHGGKRIYRFDFHGRSSGSWSFPVSPGSSIYTTHEPGGGGKLGRNFPFFWASASVDLEAVLEAQKKWPLI
jgi:hypothetical protein